MGNAFRPGSLAALRSKEAAKTRKLMNDIGPTLIHKAVRRKVNKTSVPIKTNMDSVPAAAHVITRDFYQLSVFEPTKIEIYLGFHDEYLFFGTALLQNDGSIKFANKHLSPIDIGDIPNLLYKDIESVFKLRSMF